MGSKNPAFGKSPSVKTRRKISRKLKGCSFSKKHKEKMSEKHADVKGKNNPMFGVHRYGKKAGNWKGGKIKHSAGNIMIYLPKHPFATKDGYVREHRLIIEKIIGRYLKPIEHAHHINRNKQDNRPQNLMAFKNNISHKLFEAGRKIKFSDIIFNGIKY
jgi:hypothetical protein